MRCITYQQTTACAAHDMSSAEEWFLFGCQQAFVAAQLSIEGTRCTVIMSTATTHATRNLSLDSATLTQNSLESITHTLRAESLLSFAIKRHKGASKDWGKRRYWYSWRRRSVAQ
jgi:hypothetical protein